MAIKLRVVRYPSMAFNGFRQTFSTVESASVVRQPKLIPLLEDAITEHHEDRFKAVIDTALGNAATESEKKRIET